MDQILKELEALIYLSDEGVLISDLNELYNMDMSDNIARLKELKKDCGVCVSIKDEKVFFETNVKCSEIISKFYNPMLKLKSLSASSMETLVIIALKGPITKQEIENIKDMSVDGSIASLLEKKLISSDKRKKSMGNPKLYEVTDSFYEYIGYNKEQLFALDNVAQFLNSTKGINDEDQ